MPNFDGTGPAGAGSMSGLRRGRCNGRGRGLGEMAGRGGQRWRCQGFAGMAGLGGHWLCNCIEGLEQHIARLQQRLNLLKAQSEQQADPAQH